MKSILSLVFFFLLTSVVLSQEKPVAGGGFVNGILNKPAISAGITDKPGAKALTVLTYDLDLFPGQVSADWFYCWSTDVTKKGNYKENPEVDWLSISSGKFTSTGCSDIKFVKISYTAPLTEGNYEATLTDSLSNWEAVKIYLKVTRRPEKNTTIRRIGIYTDSVVYKDYLMHFPLSWESNTCVPYYFPRDTMSFNFQSTPVVSWLKISPLSGKIYKNEYKEYNITIRKRNYDSTYVVLGLENRWSEFYRSYVKTVVPKEGLLYFNGTNMINTGYFPNSSTKTLMYWVRFDAIDTDQLFGVSDGENHRFYLGVQKNNTLFAGLGNSYTPSTNLNLVPGKWYHMAMTTSADNDSAKVYINGTEVSRFPFSFSGMSKANFIIGFRNDFQYYNGPVKGFIEEVQVWERPLTRSEIIKYMFAPPGGNESGLIINYTFMEGWGDFTRNIANNNYSGMFEDQPQWIDTIKRPANMSELITSVEEYGLNAENTINLISKPNPFKSATEITYNLDGNGKALLELYDFRGVRIRTLLNENIISGTNTFNLSDATLPAGVYFVKLIVTNSKGNLSRSIRLIKTD